MNKDKCLFCKSEQIECLDFGTEIIKTLEKPVNLVNMQESTRQYSTYKYICLECGAIFEVMKEATLEKYNQEKQYFK